MKEGVPALEDIPMLNQMLFKNDPYYRYFYEKIMPIEQYQIKPKAEMAEKRKVNHRVIQRNNKGQEVQSWRNPPNTSYQYAKKA